MHNRHIKMYRTFAVLIIGFAACQVVFGAEPLDSSGDPELAPSEAISAALSETDVESEFVPVDVAPVEDTPASPRDNIDSGTQEAPKRASTSPQNHWMARSGTNYNMFHPMNMMNPMMGLVSPMANNPIDAMTQMQTMDMMMRAMDPPHDVWTGWPGV